MSKYICLSLLILNCCFSHAFATEYKYVSAMSGLNFRDKPQGNILGKFIFGQKVEVTEHSKVFETIKDNKEFKKGEWVGIEVLGNTVYVFDAYLTKEKPVIYKENDWPRIKKNLVLKQKNNDQIINWLHDNINAVDENAIERATISSMFTSTCSSFIKDVNQLGYYGHIQPDEFKLKWGSTFDLDYIEFVHAFENGNAGWEQRNLKKINYLGELNNGDWFKITITGGIAYNGYSQTLVRVIKVIKDKSSFKISNFLSLQDG